MKTFTLLLSLCVITQGFSQNTNSDAFVRGTTASSGSSEVVEINGSTFIVQQSIGQASPIGTVSSDGKTVVQGFIQPDVSAKILTPDIPEDLQLDVYPNPFNNFLVIDLEVLPLGMVGVTVFDLLGSDVSRKAYPASRQLTVDLSSLTSGYYFLKVESNGSQHVEKILKTN
jgi:hypothetical protein